MSGEKLPNCEDFLAESERGSSGASPIAEANQEDLTSPGETNNQSENTTESSDDNEPSGLSRSSSPIVIEVLPDLPLSSGSSSSISTFGYRILPQYYNAWDVDALPRCLGKLLVAELYVCLQNHFKEEKQFVPSQDLSGGVRVCLNAAVTTITTSRLARARIKLF